jgi:hypothetical protein
MLARELLEKPFVQGDPLYDKVFALAEKITRNDNDNWEIEIGNAPIVFLNEKVRDANPDLGNCPTVNEVRDGQTPYFLFSGGTFLQTFFPTRNGGTEMKLAVLQRDGGAPVEAGSYTGPAGRAGEHLSRNSVVETNEEFVIFSGGQVLAFSGTGISEHEAYGFKQEQVKRRLGAIDVGVRCIELDAWKHSPGLQRIITTIDCKEADKVYGLGFFEEKTRTLEVRMVVSVDLEPDAVVFDGEPFGRNAAFLTPGEMKNLPMVYALREYVSMF